MPVAVKTHVRRRRGKRHRRPRTIDVHRHDPIILMAANRSGWMEICTTKGCTWERDYWPTPDEERMLVAQSQALADIVGREVDARKQAERSAREMLTRRRPGRPR